MKVRLTSLEVCSLYTKVHFPRVYSVTLDNTYFGHGLLVAQVQLYTGVSVLVSELTDQCSVYITHSKLTVHVSLKKTGYDNYKLY